MSSKERLTKYTAYYRCPDKINNFKVRIRYRLKYDADINTNKTDEWHTRVFSWQEKSYSPAERHFYGDIHNCITDLEKKIHEKVLEEVGRDNTVFTYIKDECIPDEEINGNKPTNFQSMVENAHENPDSNQVNLDEFNYTKSLLSSIEKCTVTYTFEKMYVMADLGENIENIWIKNEQQICLIKYYKHSKILSLYPDFTTILPYNIKIQGETTKHFCYFIENCSEKVLENTSLEENNLLKKLADCKLSLRRQVVGDIFHLPTKDKLYVYLFFEILSAKNFEYSDICVQYNIDLPEYWSCEKITSLRGVTQLCRGINEENIVHFGHCFDVLLEYNLQSLQQNGLSKTPYIYFEVFSKTTWDRYRTEGLAYKSLAVSNPGVHVFTLSCFRLMSRPSGDLRRFFIGDCSNYNDIRWIGIPKETEVSIQGGVINKFGVNTVGTGQLNIRLNVIHQSQAYLNEFNEGNHRQKLLYEKLSSSSLIKSVEQVLQAFRKAKNNLNEIRKNVL